VLAVLSWRQAGIWHDSETLWTHTVRVDDRCSLAHNNLAIMLKKAGKLQEALQHYERAVEINPDDANAHFNLGNCHKALEQYDQAIACYQQAIERQKRIKKKPVHEQAHMNLGNTYLHLKNLDGAIEHHRYLVKVNANRSAEFYNLLGRNLLKQAKELSGRERDGHLTEAQEYLQRAIRKKPEYPTALCNLAESLIEHGRCGEAVEYAERARTLRPQAKTPRRLLNRAQTECGP
ncbi:MAG: tetratricopeptide repeat protein, partial [bacterium]|nr:tetratricopeptide repeat protein [bacterium]